ncbi:hypothetical protein F4775DRAFT_314811 [Biscogniauxia sp. FL1348]|nr:hypothetical protein F4775DRAFT_314811 [Biscogniauxia sp. FL1348]
MVVSIVLIFVPALLGLKRLPPNITNPGSNSLALSAACHCSPLSYAVTGKAKLPDSPTTTSPSPSPTPSFARPPSSYLPVGSGSSNSYAETGDLATSQTFEMQTLGGSSSSLSASRQDDYEDEDVEDEEERGSTFARLARSEIRWGVVRMPPEWHAEYDGGGGGGGDGPVGHLGFGVEEDGVGDPVVGRLYA